MKVAVPFEPLTNESPVVCDSVRVPCATVRVSLRLAAPASASASEMALPFGPENASVVSSSRACAPGAVITGRSLTAVTWTFRVAAAPKAFESVATNDTVRVAVVGASHELR